MMRVRVCRTDEVPAGEVRAFPVPGLAVPVLVAHIAGRFHAASSQCPHEEVSLIDGSLRGLTITCPGHGYELDLATGACAHDPDLHLPTYPVTIIGDAVYIDLI